MKELKRIKQTISLYKKRVAPAEIDEKLLLNRRKDPSKKIGKRKQMTRGPQSSKKKKKFPAESSGDRMEIS